jgi:hypothetical protein
MTDKIIKIHNAETNEETERLMNSEELAQWDKDNLEKLAKLEADAVTATDKDNLLKKLGITEDEARLLLS